jgi:hypothetical protein
MAGYGCARTYARRLGYEDAAELLPATLDEEGEADEKLTGLAETVVNVEAEEADDSAEEEPAPRRAVGKKATPTGAEGTAAQNRVGPTATKSARPGRARPTPGPFRHGSLGSNPG